MNVRKAKTTDFDRLVELGEMYRRESAVEQPEIDPEHTERFFTMGLSVPEVYFAAVAEDSEIRGFLVGGITPFLFSPNIIAKQELLYVEPEARKSRAAFMLVKAFLGWSKYIKADQVVMAQATGNPRVGRLFEHFGFEQTGETYAKWL